MISSLFTWHGYNKGCINSFHSSEVVVDSHMNPVDEADPSSTTSYLLDFDWVAGQGYLFVVVATMLKIVDVVCNLAVPTPTICRDHGEQAIYEVIALNRDADQGVMDEEEVMQSMRRLQKSFRVMKDQSTRSFQGTTPGTGGGTSPSLWPRLGTMGTLQEEGEGDEEKSSDEETPSDCDGDIEQLEERLGRRFCNMELAPSQHSPGRRRVGTASVYF